MRRQLHVVRKHIAWVLLMSLVSTVAASVIGATREVPWRCRVKAFVRREAFLRVSPELYSLLSEELIPESVRDAVTQEAAELAAGVKLSVQPEGLQGLGISTEGSEEEAVKELAGQLAGVFNRWFAGRLVGEIDSVTRRKAGREGKLTRLAEDLQDVLRAARRLEIIQERCDEERLNNETISAKLKKAGERAAPDRPEEVNSTLSLKRQRLVEQIVKLEMQAAEMETRYTVNHPRFQATRSKLRQLSDRLKELSPPAADPQGLRALQLASLDSAARLEVLEKHLKEAGEQGVLARKNKVQLRIRRAVLDSEIIALSERLARLDAVRSVAPLKLTAPIEPLRPPSPWANVLRALPFGLILGMVMGVIFAMMVEYLRETCSTPGEIFSDLGLSTLAVIPRLPPEAEKLTSPDRPHSELAETFSILRNNLRYSTLNDPQKLVLVTSPLPGEGKSLIAANLAISHTFEGLKVLLIDADMRRSKGHPQLAASREVEGLVAWLEGRLSLPEGAAASTAVEGLSLVPAGGRAGNATKLLSSPRMGELLRWAQAEYDVVVVDTPAVLPVADTTIFSQQARATIVVVDANSTRTSAARAAVSRLAHVRSNLVGAVLNRADRRAMGYMSYYSGAYGYGGYGYRYSYSPD